jgi:hypothetical protein
LDSGVFEQLIRTVGDAVGSWMYVIAGALAFAEAAILIGMVLPGETALLVAGVFCRPPGQLNLWVMIVVAITCAIAGDSNSDESSVRRCVGPGWVVALASAAGRPSTASSSVTAGRRCSSVGSPRCCGRSLLRWPA